MTYTYSPEEQVSSASKGRSCTRTVSVLGSNVWGNFNILLLCLCLSYGFTCRVARRLTAASSNTIWLRIREGAKRPEWLFATNTRFQQRASPRTFRYSRTGVVCTQIIVTRNTTLRTERPYPSKPLWSANARLMKIQTNGLKCFLNQEQAPQDPVLSTWIVTQASAVLECV